MITCDNLSLYRENNLRYIGEHKQAFQVEYIYPLDIFESLVEKTEKCAIECSCKIEEDKLYPIRFNLAFRNKRYVEEAATVLEFFNKVETRVGVKLNHDLFQQFVDNFDFSKVNQIMTGIDLREEFTDSRVKTWWSIDRYPEKVETAIALQGDSEELRSLILNYNRMVIGFHLYLDGRSTVRLYPNLLGEELRQANVQLWLVKVLSPPALQLLDACSGVSFVLDKDNQDKIIHYHLHQDKANYFIDNLHNDMASRVHAYYRDKPVRFTTVSLSERELVAGSIQTINMYYMNK